MRNADADRTDDAKNEIIKTETGNYVCDRMVFCMYGIGKADFRSPLVYRYCGRDYTEYRIVFDL